MFWGLNSIAGVRARLQLFKTHLPKVSLAVLIAGAVMFLQAAYWKYATGEWIVYSYEDQGFTWMPPHIEDVLWSARAGWLVYSPIMIFAIVGLFMLRKRLPTVFPTVLLYCLLALYITFAWDIWWYGGSLGQRAMVQAYPLWAFGLAAFWAWVSRRNWRQWVFIVLAGVCVYLNLWWSHQAHRGGLFVSEQMTRRYMLKILGRLEVERDWLKLLDTKDEFKGAVRKEVKEVLSKSFDRNTPGKDSVAFGNQALVLTKDLQFSPEFDLPVKSADGKWIRAYTTFRCEPKEWDWWSMTQFVIRFRQGDKIVKERMIRLQRHVDGGEQKSIFFDTKIPSQPFDRVSILLWNAGSNKTVHIEDLRAEIFN